MNYNLLHIDLLVFTRPLIVPDEETTKVDFAGINGAAAFRAQTSPVASGSRPFTGSARRAGRPRSSLYRRRRARTPQPQPGQYLPVGGCFGRGAFRADGGRASRQGQRLSLEGQASNRSHTSDLLPHFPSKEAECSRLDANSFNPAYI